MVRALALLLALGSFGPCGGCSTSPPLPPRAAQLNALGADALAQGDLEAADTRLSLALEYSPDFVEALTNLGLVEIRRGNFVRAEQLLSRSLRLNPDIAQTHHGLGVLEERRSRLDLAAEHYRDSLAVDPGFVESRANLARLLFEARQYEHALVQYRLLVEANPDRLEGFFGLGSALLSLDRYDEARALVALQSTRFPNAAEWALLEGRLLLLTGSPQAALERLLSVTRDRSPLAVSGLAWAAVCELALDRPERAKALASEALALEPDDPLVVFALALALDETNDASAGPWLERALLANPANAELRLRAHRRHREVPQGQRPE
jgi:tetratricopeptide (TPR) repeat protein